MTFDTTDTTFDTIFNIRKKLTTIDRTFDTNH